MSSARARMAWEARTPRRDIAREVAGLPVLLLGINVGSLGFLTNVAPETLKPALDLLANGISFTRAKARELIGLYEKAGIKEVATIHDKKAYGQGLVESFTSEFEKLGGKVVAAETIMVSAA